jgi:2,3-bisphosphoglycerate-dependent phosphoglycerate mutase
VDVPLTEKGYEEASRAGELLRDYRFDRYYTSALKRAHQTLDTVLETMGVRNLTIVRNEALNERHYGDLQGKNKAETAEEFGEEQVHIWRRSYDVPPPGGESLKDTAARTLPYFEERILPDLRAGRNTLVVAHGNSLRSIVMQLDDLSRDEVLQLNLGTGVPYVYRFDDAGRVVEKTVLGGE